MGETLLHCITDDERSMLQKSLLHMLMDFQSVCEKHHLRYTLGGGSALGAVRHHGFIPWDDDLDINMPREDYEKFKVIFPREMGAYYDMSAPGTEHVVYGFMKIYKKGTVMREAFDDFAFEGLWLDIFPMDYVPENKIHRWIKGCLSDGIQFLASSLLISQHKNKATKEMYQQRKWRYRAAVLIGALIPVSAKRVVNFFDKFVIAEKSKYMTIPTGRNHYAKETLYAEDFLPPIKGIFEGQEICLPHRADKYLTHLYGDYMQIPPPEKRESHKIAEFYVSPDVQWMV